MTNDKSTDLIFMDAELVIMQSIETINRTAELLSEVVPYLKYKSDVQTDVELKNQFRQLVVSIEKMAMNCVQIFDSVSLQTN